jgi:hypothetical protein
MHSPNVSPFFFLVHLSQYPLVQTRHEPISAPQQPLKRPISLVAILVAGVPVSCNSSRAPSETRGIEIAFPRHDLLVLELRVIAGEVVGVELAWIQSWHPTSFWRL